MLNPYAPPEAIVDDIVESQEIVLAERLTRFFAALLDGIIFAVAVYLPLMLIAAGTDSQGNVSDADGNVNPLVITGTIGTIVGFSVWCFFTIRFLSQNSQSIAKKFLDIKVVRSDGARASISRIFWARNVVISLLGAIPYLGWVIGVTDALCIFSDTRQCLHDRIADTIVIKA